MELIHFYPWVSPLGNSVQPQVGPPYSGCLRRFKALRVKRISVENHSQISKWYGIVEETSKIWLPFLHSFISCFPFCKWLMPCLLQVKIKTHQLRLNCHWVPPTWTHGADLHGEAAEVPSASGQPWLENKWQISGCSLTQSTLINTGRILWQNILWMRNTHKCIVS